MSTFWFRADLRCLPLSAAPQPIRVQRAEHPAGTRLCTYLIFSSLKVLKPFSNTSL